MNKLLPLIALSCVLSTLNAQSVKQYAFTHYYTSSGLPSNQVFSICQDEKGYLWMGTSAGLVRFDGIRYKVFRKQAKDPNSLPFTGVIRVMMDGKNRLWVKMANNQIGIFNTHSFRFEAVKILASDSSYLSLTYTLSKDGFGQVFLNLGEKELLIWDDLAHAFRPCNDFFPKKPDWNCIEIFHQPGTQKYWSCLRGKGLAVYNQSSGQLSYLGNNLEQEDLIDATAGFNNIIHAFFDSKGRFWFVSWDKAFSQLFCYDLRQHKFVVWEYNFGDYLHSYFEITGFLEQSNGTIWVKGLGILASFEEDKGNFRMAIPVAVSMQQLVKEDVYALFEDREKNIWAGTSSDGLYRFDPSKDYFTNVSYPNKYDLNKKSEASPLDFFLDCDNTLLVSVWGEGLYRFDLNFNRIPLNIKGFSEGNTIAAWDMCRDTDDEHAWFACQPGIMRYDMKKRSVEVFNPPILENRTVRQIEVDSSGNLWLGTQSLGVFKWDARKGARNFDAGLSKVTSIDTKGAVNLIYKDSRGLFWIATGQNGAFVWDPRQERVLMHFSDKAQGAQRLPETGVSAILEYNDSLMVLTTVTNIILYNRLNDQCKVLFNDDNISGNIASLEKDRDGNLWLGTTTHLYRIRPGNRALMSFNREDGLMSDEFMLSTSGQLPDGRMLFGASSELVVFRPESIVTKTTPPQITITDFVVNNRSWPIDSLLGLEAIELGPDENALNIQFSPLSYSQLYAIQFKMEGLDKNWVLADGSYQAVYSYLPPGTYHFKFRTIDSEGKYSEEVQQFVLKVQPPFWQSWWFYAILMLLSGALLFWLDQERMKRKEAVTEVRNKIAADLHQEVNTALQNINILSEMANIKADSDPQKSKEFIQQIHRKSNRMIASLDDMLWSISPENDSMAQTVERMQEFIEKLNARGDAQIQMLVEDRVKRLQLNMKTRYEAFQIFKEGAERMLEVCPEGFKLHITLEKSGLRYMVYYGSNHYDETALNNLMQRRDLNRRIEAIGATWDLCRQKNGFEFELNIPIISPSSV